MALLKTSKNLNFSIKIVKIACFHTFAHQITHFQTNPYQFCTRICWGATGTGVTGARKDGTIQVPTDGNMWNFGVPQNVHPSSSNYPTTCQSKPQETQISNGNVSCSCRVVCEPFYLEKRCVWIIHSTYAQCVWQSILFISFAQNSADNKSS